MTSAKQASSQSTTEQRDALLERLLGSVILPLCNPRTRRSPPDQRYNPARRARSLADLHRQSEQEGPRRRRLVQMGDVLKTRNLRRGKNLVSLEIA